MGWWQREKLCPAREACPGCSLDSYLFFYYVSACVSVSVCLSLSVCVRTGMHSMTHMYKSEDNPIRSFFLPPLCEFQGLNSVVRPVQLASLPMGPSHALLWKVGFNVNLPQVVRITRIRSLNGRTVSVTLTGVERPIQVVEAPAGRRLKTRAEGRLVTVCSLDLPS